jgi:predicted metal-dependent hydrolase
MRLTISMDPLLRQGIHLFNHREFFDCHEVLEEAWTPQRGPRRLFLQALIHVAVGFYHCQRGNPVGASRQLRKALRKLAPYLPSCEGVDTDLLYRQAQEQLDRIEAGETVDEFPGIHTLEAVGQVTDLPA